MVTRATQIRPKFDHDQEKRSSRIPRKSDASINDISKSEAGPKSNRKSLNSGNASITATGRQLKSLRHGLGMSQYDMSRMLSLSVRSLSAVENDLKKLSSDDIRRINEMTRLYEALAAIIKPQFIGEWFKEPSQLFNGLSAMEVIERGEIDRIWRMVHHIQDGGQS